jgi:DNA invertase Pin-like site-specific DNA recombinase
MTTATIAYLRVSTGKQADQGLSLDAQQEKATTYARLYDLELVEVIIDAGESAKTLERPGLQRALALLQAGQADALLIIKLDRLTRSVADLGRLIDDHFAPGKAELLSVSEQIDTRSASGRLVLNILASVSQWEREIIAERTRDVMRYKQNQGEYIGGYVPYGFEVIEGALVENPLEQHVIQQAQSLHATGLSLRKVSAALQQRGFQARTGATFHPGQIQRMLEAKMGRISVPVAPTRTETLGAR